MSSGESPSLAELTFLGDGEMALPSVLARTGLGTSTAN